MSDQQLLMKESASWSWWNWNRDSYRAIFKAVINLQFP